MNFQVDTSNFLEDQICSLFANTCMSQVQFSHWLTGKIDFFTEDPVYRASENQETAKALRFLLFDFDFMKIIQRSSKIMYLIVKFVGKYYFSTYY